MSKTSHECLKEAEIATMAERIKNIDKNVNELSTQLKSFIETADKKYASNQRVDALEKVLVRTENRVYKLMKEVAIWGTLVAVIAKMYGLI